MTPFVATFTNHEGDTFQVLVIDVLWPEAQYEPVNLLVVYDDLTLGTRSLTDWPRIKVEPLPSWQWPKP